MSDLPIHVVPTDDLVEHDLGLLEDCICGPDLIDGGRIAVHHSLDGREKHEVGGPE